MFESVSTSGRLRNVSSSSASFAFPSLGSCDIFPEIAGVVSASDSETDISEYLVRGQDCFRSGDFVFSPPRPRFRQNSEKQCEDVDEASIREMLDTLCYTVHDLTHVNDVVENVILDWQNGATLDDSLTASEVVVETEPSCESIDLNSNDSLITGYIATLSEGMCVFLKLVVAWHLTKCLQKLECYEIPLRSFRTFVFTVIQNGYFFVYLMNMCV